MKRATSARSRAGTFGAATEHRRQRRRGFGIVILVGAGQRHDQAAGDLMGEPMHVVDLRRHEQLADIGKHRVGHDRAGRVLHAIDGGGDAAGKEAFDDLDEIDHRIADMSVTIGIEPVRLDHQRAGADQQIAETGARADAGMAMMRRV